MELWDVLDRRGQPTGASVERGQPLPDGAYHLVVDIWIVNHAGEYLISRRCADKFPDPGLWEPTCGSVVAGESSLSAALREVREELGIALEPGRGRFIKRVTVHNNTIVDVWLFRQEADINAVVLQPGETDAAVWAGAGRIHTLLEEGRFLSRARLPYLDELLAETAAAYNNKINA